MRLNDFVKVVLILLTFIVISCKKDSVLTDSSARLDFSEDTILFDTVFTSVGSTTQYLLVYNNNNQPVNISRIWLAKGGSSYYRINVNGLPGNSFNDIEIRAKDSLWIFIEVTIDPNPNANTPFLVTDSILFELNGNIQDVDLVAFGQDAHFIVPDKAIKFEDGSGFPYSIVGGNNVTCGTVVEWDSIKPYVVYGYAVVDSCTTLKIKEGTKIYFFNNSGLWIYRYGNLQVEGTKDHPVTFQGTRLEQTYTDVPNQWDRIWINEQGSNSINYAVVKNSFIGIQAEDTWNETYNPLNEPSNLKLTNTIIKNNSIGLYAKTFKIDMDNCVVANSGSYCTAVTQGGDYTFRQNTFANYWRYEQRSTPTFFMNDFISDGVNNIHIPLEAHISNSIIYGNTDNEIEIDLVDSANDVYDFKNCLFKVDETVTNISNSHFINALKNLDPQFENTNENDYHFSDSSPCVDAGDAVLIQTPPILKDLDGEDRVKGTNPDLGAYEKQ